MIINRIQLALVLVTSIFTQDALSYVHWTCPNGSNFDFNGGHMTFNLTDSLTSAQKTAIERGTDRITLFSDSSITLIDNDDNDFGTGNGENEIYMDPTHNTAACSISYNTTTCVVNQADIRFGTPNWTTNDNSIHSPYSPPAGERSMTGTAVHEGGHCVGLAHENRYYNMMGDDWSHVTRNSTNAYYGPGEDMSNGLISLHGKKSATDAYRDVGATVMRYSHASGAYSAHKFGVLRDSTGVVLPAVVSYVGQNMYEVDAGSSIRMELTLENNGEQYAENPSLGIYVSTNDFISASDRLIRSASPTVNRNVPYETYYTVTIPSDLMEDDYFLNSGRSDGAQMRVLLVHANQAGHTNLCDGCAQLSFFRISRSA